MSDENDVSTEPVSTPTPAVEPKPTEEPYTPPPGLGPDFVNRVSGEPNKKTK